jgi:hypothetical protein
MTNDAVARITNEKVRKIAEQYGIQIVKGADGYATKTARVL